MKKPLAQAEIQRRLRDSKTEIVMARQDATEALRPYVDQVLTAVRAVFNIQGAIWASDESCLSDFFDGDRDRSQDQRLYDRIGKKLGLSLDRANNDDHVIVKIALKLKRCKQAPN